MRRRHSLTLLAGTVALALAAPPASAFCRITTIETVSDGDDTTACYDTTHPPVWWKTACVGLSVQSGGSKYAPYGVVDDILFHEVIPNWTHADCPAGGHPSIDVIDLGPAECDRHQDNLYGPNANVVLFQDDAWPYEETEAGCKPGDCCDMTIALTTVTFHPETGELWDADIEINSHCHPISTTLPVPSGSYDLQSILQHETGHFLGLAHPPDPAAIMFYLYSPGSDGKRTLNTDDISGACTIYPPSGERSVAPIVVQGGLVPEGACDPTPRNGFSSSCVSHADNQQPALPASALSCQSSRSPTRQSLPTLGITAAALLAGAFRSRRRVHRRGACYSRSR